MYSSENMHSAKVLTCCMIYLQIFTSALACAYFLMLMCPSDLTSILLTIFSFVAAMMAIAPWITIYNGYFAADRTGKVECAVGPQCGVMLHILTMIGIYGHTAYVFIDPGRCASRSPIIFILTPAICVCTAISIAMTFNFMRKLERLEFSEIPELPSAGRQPSSAEYLTPYDYGLGIWP